MSIDFASLNTILAGSGIAVVGGWIGAFFALRKDERGIHIKQITEERTKWRGAMRSLTTEIVNAYGNRSSQTEKHDTLELRARLATNLNPKCEDDNKIIEHFDKLFAGSASDVEVFTKRMALLLKHDWERCKWESTPIYEKPFIRFTKKQREWRSQRYREV